MKKIKDYLKDEAKPKNNLCMTSLQMDKDLFDSLRFKLSTNKRTLKDFYTACAKRYLNEK